jgi:hypothetical protein
MGTYSDYLNSRALLDRGKPEGARVESVEVRVNAAMDVDEAAKAALERVMGFLAAYYAEREPEITLAEAYMVGTEDHQLWGGRLWKDIQRLATRGSQSLLFDDLRILVDRLANPPGKRS